MDDFRFEDAELPLHATMPWADLGPVEVRGTTCRYCDQPVHSRGSVVCKAHVGYYIQMMKRVKRQVARLCELARERRG